MRVSSEHQDLSRQEAILENAIKNGYYIGGAYREKASGAITERPELQRMIADLQEGDVVIAEKLDRLSRLPVDEAEVLFERMRSKGARLAIPDVVDLSEIAASTNGAARIVLDALQAMLFKLALHMARDEYETRRIRQAQGVARAKTDGKYKGRKANKAVHKHILELRKEHSIAVTAAKADCSISQVKRVVAKSKSRAVRHALDLAAIKKG